MKLNSLVREYQWAWSGDPALDTPPKDASKEAVEAWEVKLQNAHDTGNYREVTKAGADLTVFSLRIIPEPLYRKALDDWQNRVNGGGVTNCLLVKLAVRKVANLSDFDGKPFDDSLKHEPGLGEVVSGDLLDLLAAYAREAKARGWNGDDPITEMAHAIVQRQSGPSPK